MSEGINSDRSTT